MDARVMMMSALSATAIPPTELNIYSGGRLERGRHSAIFVGC